MEVGSKNPPCLLLVPQRGIVSILQQNKRASTTYSMLWSLDHAPAKLIGILQEYQKDL